MARISTAQRRHADYLRLRGLKVAHAYEKKLLRLRRKEVRRVLGLCAEWSNTDLWPGIIQNELREDYLPKWWEDLFIGCGVDMAKSTVRDLRKAKAADDLTVWERMLRDYAFDRSGQAIVSVTGTLKDDLLNILSDRLSHELEGGIEKLARSIYEGFDDLALWQCRRIAQTEGMIAMADAAEGAARSLDIPMTKVWMCSGLKNSRESHLAVDGVEVEMDEPFILAGGSLMYPHDTSLGADAGEIINCACSCGYRPKGSSSRPSAEPQAAPSPAEPAPKTPEQIREERIGEIMKEKPSDLTEEVRRKLAENDLEVEKLLGITKGEPMSIDDADTGHSNPNWKTLVGYTSNCSTCSPTFMMRTRGFDVTAGPTTNAKVRELSYGTKWVDKWQNADGTKVTPHALSDWARGKGYEKVTAGRYMEFVQEYTKTPGIYEMSIGWKGSKYNGHSFIIYRRPDGKLLAVDGQSGKYSEELLRDYLSLGKQMNNSCRGIVRIDDKLFNTDYLGIFAKGSK